MLRSLPVSMRLCFTWLGDSGVYEKRTKRGPSTVIFFPACLSPLAYLSR